MAAAARLLGIAAVGLVALLTAHAGPALGAAERGSIHEVSKTAVSLEGHTWTAELSLSSGPAEHLLALGDGF